MTKGEARELFLRYLGAATLNGIRREDPDLPGQFEAFLAPALLAVGSAFPPTETVRVLTTWTAPEDFIEITGVRDRRGNPVPYYRCGEKSFRFAGRCTVEYTRRPALPDAAEGDAAVLDLEERAAQLVPLQIAVYAAAALPEEAYRVPYLAANYQALSAVLDVRNAPAFRRVFAL